MSNAYEAACGYIKDEFVGTYPVCGAVYKVIVPGQKGHEELMEKVENN